ncbi:DNA-binding protein [bacterium]|nr:MAG: DNA-binding protein [bacterium]
MKGERMLSVRETAEIMGWCLDSVRRKLRSGELPGVRLGRNWRVPESQLASFIGVDHIGVSSDVEVTYENKPVRAGRKKSDSVNIADPETEVVDALLKTEAAQHQVLELVRQALDNTEISPKVARQTLIELGDMLRAL